MPKPKQENHNIQLVVDNTIKKLQAWTLDSGDAMLAVADILEAYNEHDLAHAIWSIYLGETELAQRFVEMSNFSIGSEVRRGRAELMEQYEELFED